jgi:hypothetical protein
MPVHAMPVHATPAHAMPAPPLWLRGPVFVVTSTFLAVAAHLAGGGSAPDIVRLAVALLVSGVAFSFVARREQGALAVAVAVLGAQAVLHLVLVAAPPVAPGTLEHGPHATTPVPSDAGTALMWCAHVAAALATAAWLRHGERHLWDALARALVVLVVPVRVSPVPAPRPGVVMLRTPRPHRSPALAVCGLRGPPMTGHRTARTA